MTTRIQIKNLGPENAAVWYYDETRQFKPHKDLLLQGESIEMDIWNGHLPVMMAMGHMKAINSTGKFFAVPPTNGG